MGIWEVVMTDCVIIGGSIRGLGHRVGGLNAIISSDAGLSTLWGKVKMVCNGG